MFSNLLIKIYSFPKVIFSAISGHSPAGGTVIAIMTDYRIMSKGKYFIGLNEVAVGLTMPVGIGSVFKNVLGYRMAEKMTMKGELVFPDKAQKLGLIDELFDNKEGNIIDFSVNIMKESSKKENEMFLKAWFSDECRLTMKGIINNISKK